MVDPLVVEFVVDVPPAHAFEVWTGRCALWWPPGHTISGSPARIRFEPHPGGRILEEAADGTTHLWGEVIDWQPPTRLRFWWHLFFAPDQATEVEISFNALGSSTAVRLEQRGWERLGAAGEERRRRTGAAWATITQRYRSACGDADARR